MSVLSEGLQRYLSSEALATLARALVGIAGCGGLGSNVAMILVRSGVRRLRLIDGDLIEASNLNRQQFWPEDIGKSKALTLRDRVLGLDAELEIDARDLWIEPTTAHEIFRDCDVVVEAFDRASLKAEFCAALVSHDFFVVAASGLGWAGPDAPPMRIRRLGRRLVCVGDFIQETDDLHPPLAPRVIQAAALQAEVVVSHLLS